MVFIIIMLFLKILFTFCNQFIRKIKLYKNIYLLPCLLKIGYFIDSPLVSSLLCHTLCNIEFCTCFGIIPIGRVERGQFSSFWGGVLVPLPWYRVLTKRGLSKTIKVKLLENLSPTEYILF